MQHALWACSCSEAKVCRRPSVAAVHGCLAGRGAIRLRICDPARQMPSAERRRAAAEDLSRADVHDAEVCIVEYDPAWPTAFQAERDRLAPLLEGAQIHHFGSTAVPGLAAKPVIDMIALVPDLEAPIRALVHNAGYQFPRAFNATLTHRRFLCYPSASHRTHHLHLVDEREELERRLRFRDRLRADHMLAAQYVALKGTLAERHHNDREAYTDAKSEFIRHHERPVPVIEPCNDA